MIKVININHIKNFRELGGYFTKDNRMVKFGYLYRSAGLCDMNEKDLADFEQFHIQYILDLRTKKDFAVRPDKYPATATHYAIPAVKETAYNLAHTMNFFDLLHENISAQEIVDANAFLREVYTFIAFDNEAFKCFFNLMKDNQAPLLFHCAGGKDRTGVLAALILKLLGVSDEDIMKDYLYSNVFLSDDDYVKAQIKQYHITDLKLIETIYETCGVQEQYLISFFESIEKKYGTIENYFLQEYQIDEQATNQIRNFYLQGEMI